jgi:hypothetical protein
MSQDRWNWGGGHYLQLSPKFFVNIEKWKETGQEYLIYILLDLQVSPPKKMFWPATIPVSWQAHSMNDHKLNTLCIQNFVTFHCLYVTVKVD